MSKRCCCPSTLPASRWPHQNIIQSFPSSHLLKNSYISCGSKVNNGEERGEWKWGMWRGTGHESCLIPGCGAPSRSAVQNILPGDGWILFLEICLHRAPSVFTAAGRLLAERVNHGESFFFFFLCLINPNHFSFRLSFTKQQHESPPSKAKPTRRRDVSSK